VLKRKGDLGSPVIVDFGLAKAARARDKMEVCERCAVGAHSAHMAWRRDAMHVSAESVGLPPIVYARDPHLGALLIGCMVTTPYRYYGKHAVATA
jgi:hypothetical protein